MIYTMHTIQDDLHSAHPLSNHNLAKQIVMTVSHKISCFYVQELNKNIVFYLFVSVVFFVIISSYTARIKK
jgi:hypothetical protein